MSVLSVSVATIDALTGDELFVGELSFEAIEAEAVARDPRLGLPQWKRLPLPSNEVLEMFVAFQAGSTSISMAVRAGSANVSALMCDAPQVLKFLSPGGDAIVLSFGGGV